MPSPIWAISIYDEGLGGYGIDYLRAPSREAAIRKAHITSSRWLQWIKRISEREIMEGNLERLWRFYPDIYLEAWMPGIKGIDLLRKAKRILGKTGRLYVFRYIR